MFKRRNRVWVAVLLAGALVAGLATQAFATPVTPDRPTGLTAVLNGGGGGDGAEPERRGARIKVTNSNGQDSGAQPGWSIRNNGWSKTTGFPWATSDSDAQAIKVRVNGFVTGKASAEVDTTVPSDWSLTPAGLSAGNQFRLIFLSSTKRDGSSSNITTYNSFIQDLAAAGHTDIQAYSDHFTVVGCTAAADARDNTGTTYTSSNKGVPIYWLNGNKVADDYEDFYDENWDDEANAKNELGNNGPDTSQSTNYPLTGCDHDGTEAFSGSNSRGLAGSLVRLSRPNSSAANRGPLSSSSNVGNGVDRPMYGLSPVFEVAAVGAATGKPAIMGTANVGQTLTASKGTIVDTNGTTKADNGDSGYAYTYQWVRVSGGTETTISGATGTTYTPVADDVGNTIKVQASFTDDADNAEGPLTSDATAAVVEVVDTTVPSDWSLIPAGLTTGDTFRLIFLSSTKRNASATDIATYNTFIQTRAAAGHTDIQAYSDGFTAVGCTADADAVGNTGTFGVGVPIYWLSGAKVADDYADFYDGDWDEEAAEKNELGANGLDTIQSANYPLTGCDDDGTVTYSALGQSYGLGTSESVVTVGRPDSSDTGHGPIAGSLTDPATNRPMYGLSAVFEVTAAEVPSDWSLIPTGRNIGDQFRLIFLSSTKRDGSSSNITTYNSFIQTRAAAGHTDIQAYSDHFTVVGCTAAADARDNTGTTYTNSNKGVPIYWLNGNKVADEYEDFYDGNWDEEAADKNELGENGPNTNNSGNYPITGCDHDGTEGFLSGGGSAALGTSAVIVGRPNSSGTGHGPISGSNNGVGNGADRPMYGLSPVFEVVAPTPTTVVPSDWSLIPAGLSSGDQFRLIFLSSTKRNASATDIATYNTFIQTRAAAGHADIQTYSDGFTVVGCTADDYARDNTGTIGVGVPIYWLNGAKVADDYADFYDEDWDEEAADKNELGENGPNTNNSGNYPFTGCDHDGTEGFLSGGGSAALGTSDVIVGRPNSSGTGHGPISGGFRSDGANRPMYGLSAVFEVAGAATGKPAIMGTAEVGQTLTASKGTIVDTNGTTKADNGDSGYAYTYQWVRVSGGTETTISGATGTTYTQVADDVGNTIKVQASFTDDTDNAEGPLTSDATAAVVEVCDALWCATMTVGSSGGATGFSDGTTSPFNAMGSLSPSQFRFEGAAITMNSLAYAGSSTNVDLTLEFTHSILGSSDYTLELNDESFLLSDTGGFGFFSVEGLPARPNFANGDTVTVKLYEGVRGVTLSDDATLTSLEFYAITHQDEELVTLTPAFDAGTTEYTAVVDYRFTTASILEIVRGDSGASVVVTDEFASQDLGTGEDSVDDLDLAIGENTITVEVTAADETTETYTLVVTRTAQPPLPAHCEPGDIWCATLTVASLSADEFGYSGAQGTLSHVAFKHGGPFYLVETLSTNSASGVGIPLRINFHPSGETVFNTDDLFLYIDGTAFAFSDATFSSGYFEWADTGLSWTSADTVEVRLVEGAGTTIPADWSLIPAGLTIGDQFRLIFLSSTKRDGSATDIATYNTFIQTRAAAGHADIQAYSDGFTVVGCTEDVDAVGNTGTTGVGVPIYWLNGAKVADDYGDFYDEDWDEEDVNKNELGNNGRNTNNTNNYPLTGCDHDGTEASTSSVSESLGAAGGDVRVGRPDSSDTDHGPLSSTSTTGDTSNRPMYGLSAVFKVAAANSDPTFPMSTAARSVVENTAAGQNVGAVLTASDSDGDTLTYTLEGTDAASFELDTTTTAGSAQIQTKSGVTYDHEVKSSYAVVVKADDGGGGTAASVTVTITITDVSEAPERPAAPTVMATAGSTTSLSVSWTAPATTGPDIDDYDLRYREGTSGSWSNGPQNVTATLASIGSLDAGTSYQVQVRATNDEGNSNWSPSGSGSTTAEATPTVSISADKTSAVFKEDEITYTLTRSGSTTAAMDVTVTLTQTKDFLATTELSKTVTISAGQTTETFTVEASSFQHFAAGAQVGGGTLTATVQDGTDYDLGSPSSVGVDIVIGVMIRFEMASYSVGEAGGPLSVKLIARTGAGAPRPTSETGLIGLSSNTGTANNTDFMFQSDTLNLLHGGFSADGGRWKSDYTMTVQITDDGLDEDDETFELKIRRNDSDLAYSLVDASGDSCGSNCKVTVTITDDDTAGVTVSKPSLTVTEQDSSGDTYTVVLDSQPTANVTISIGGQSGTDVTAAPTPMTFTTGNWATAQTVTVTGDDDADLTNDMVSLTHNAASSDSDYNAITIAGLTVTVADNDTAQVTGVTVEPGNAQLVVGWSEVANASGYHVQWKSGGQSYNTSGRRAVISSGSTTSHTISSLSNGTEYTVRVRATRTGANNGAYSAEVLETPVMPTAAGVTISESALTLTEQDTTGDSYTVVLDRQPTASVTVTVGGLGSSDLTANPSSLTFTTGNWATAQTVTVTAGNDADTTNDTVSLTHSATSSDSAYHGITIAGLMVTVADNDTAQVTGLTVEPGNAQLVVEWTAVANATGYEVQWKSGGQSYNTSDRQATITSGLTTSHTISSLTNGTEYTVRVRATRTGANSGAYSAEVLETPVMPVVCDVLWCATLTVGQHPTFGTLTGFDTLYGALTPNEFTRNGSPITVNALYHTGNSNTLSMEYTGDLSGPGYTLELGSRSFDLPDPDGDGFFDVDTSRGWSVGDTVEVTLSEAIVMASDDATLESLTVSYLIDVVRTNNAPITPAFSPETTSYTAGVPSGVTQALLSATATEAGAELVVTLPDGSTQHDTGDADEVYGDVSPGLNTFTVTVTAPDGITEKVYTVIVDRGGGLSGRIENLPSSHDGSTAFSVTLKFNTDISEDSIDNLDGAVEITNGTKSDLAAVGSSKRNFTMTITPSSGDPVRILVRQTLVCSSSGHPICTDVGDALGQDIKRWVGKEDDARLSALWLTTKDGIWLGGIRSDTYSYDGRHFQSELTMQAAPYAKGATVVVTGPAGTFTAGNRWDGGATAKLDVPEGATTWRVTVTSADGNETKTYRVTVRRGAGGGGPAADVRLKTLTVTPVNGTLLSFRPGFHLDTEASTFKIRVSSGTTAVRLSLQKNTSDPEVRMMRTETRPLDALDRDPDEPGIQLSLPMGGQRLYRSIWVIGPER